MFASISVYFFYLEPNSLNLFLQAPRRVPRQLKNTLMKVEGTYFNWAMCFYSTFWGRGGPSGVSIKNALQVCLFWV